MPVSPYYPRGAEPLHDSSSSEVTRESTVFGLDVSTEIELPFLAGEPRKPTGRMLEIALGTPSEAAPSWPSTAVLVCDQREPDGRVSFRIEADQSAGFLIWGPRYGRQFLARDGSRLTCVPGGVPDVAWQRLLIAQGLPFAAALHGLEVFHASAVSTASGAVALVGRSGVGKTSVAIELCRAGATFLADDVLALERVDDWLLAHPGTPVAGLDAGYAAAREPRDGNATADPIAEMLTCDTRERLVRMRERGAATRLTAMFLLDRRQDAPATTRFQPLTDARVLLGATFNSVLTGDERLRRLLDICSIAARAQVERVLVGRATGPAALAREIAHRACLPI